MGKELFEFEKVANGLVFWLWGVLSRLCWCLLVVLALSAFAESIYGAGKSQSLINGNKDKFKPFAFAVTGDCRPARHSPLKMPEVFSEIIKDINRSDARFLLITGDMISGYLPGESEIRQQWRVFRQVCAPLKIPFYLVPGNHDIWNAQSQQIYEQLWGKRYYHFQFADCEFIIINSEELACPANISGVQLKWLERVLQAAAPRKYRFVFVHQPLWHNVESNWNSQVQPLLARYKVDTVFAGHEHRYADDGRRDGVRYIVTSGAGAPLRGGRGIGAFFHYLLVKVKDKGVELKVVEPNSPESKVPHKYAGKQLARLLAGLNYTTPEIAVDAPAKFAILPLLVNPYDSPLDFKLAVKNSEGNGWSCVNPELKLKLAPEQQKRVSLEFVYQGKKLFPLPQLSVSVFINNLKIYEKSSDISLRFRRCLEVRATEEKIVIDGILDEPDWKRAKDAGRWFNLTTRHWADEREEFKALFDGSNLYLAFKCYSADMAKLRQAATKRDWRLPMEDCVLVAFYSSQLKKNSKFVLGVTSYGVQSDFLASDRSVGFAWNPKWRAAVKRDKDHYTIEMVIPGDLFANKPFAELKLRINAGRMSGAKMGHIYCWSLPLGRVSNPAGFGYCQFEQKK